MPYVNNKGADQPAHPRSLISAFIVRCLGSIKPLVSISEISSLHLASMAAQASLCLTWSQTLKTGFLVTRLKSITQHTSRDTVYIFGILLLIKGQPTIGLFMTKYQPNQTYFKEIMGSQVGVLPPFAIFSSRCAKRSTMKVLSLLCIGTDSSWQTVQIQSRLLILEQFDQGLH